MEFEYKKYFWVDPADLGIMVDLVRVGSEVYEAIDVVVETWEEPQRYDLEWVKDDIAAFILAVVAMDKKEV